MGNPEIVWPLESHKNTLTRDELSVIFVFYFQKKFLPFDIEFKVAFSSLFFFLNIHIELSVIFASNWHRSVLCVSVPPLLLDINFD